MNKFENLCRTSRMAARMTRSAVSRNLEKRRGEEPTSSAYTLLYSPIAERLGIQKGSDAEKHAGKVASAITMSWFKTDALLDGDAGHSETDPMILAQEMETILVTPLPLDESIPSDVRHKVGEMEIAARKKAYEAHRNFMAAFDPATAIFEDALDYRTNTSGLMEETVLNAMRIASGNDGDISTLKANVLCGALCVQMCDDLVDSICDYRKGLPNLLYALTLENPSERRRFESASMNQFILDTRRPYDIAQLYAPSTLLSYMRRFQSIAALLPPDREEFVKDLMATMTHVSFSPNGTVSKVNYFEIGRMLARRTKID